MSSLDIIIKSLSFQAPFLVWPPQSNVTYYYCEGDQDILKACLNNWEGRATMGRQNPETLFGRELALLSICVSSLSLIDAQKTVPVPIRG